jgi:hypothetical protein
LFREQDWDLIYSYHHRYWEIFLRIKKSPSGYTIIKLILVKYYLDLALKMRDGSFVISIKSMELEERLLLLSSDSVNKPSYRRYNSKMTRSSRVYQELVKKLPRRLL